MEVTVIRSNRKTVAIQVNSDLSVTVRAPRLASQKDIERILKEKESWICKHIEEIKKKIGNKTTARKRITSGYAHTCECKKENSYNDYAVNDPQN